MLFVCPGSTSPSSGYNLFPDCHVHRHQMVRATWAHLSPGVCLDVSYAAQCAPCPWGEGWVPGGARPAGLRSGAPGKGASWLFQGSLDEKLPRDSPPPLPPPHDVCTDGTFGPGAAASAILKEGSLRPAYSVEVGRNERMAQTQGWSSGVATHFWIVLCRKLSVDVFIV